MNTGLCSKRGDSIPLKGVEVDGEVLGAHARVRVRQRYCNESGRAVEAVYTFPLPADATLTAFAMTCAGRRLEGSVKEREAAFHAYDDAVVAAVATLATQDRSACERALGAAWLLAMGPRTRAAIEAAIASGGYPTLGPMVGDAAKVRAWVG